MLLARNAVCLGRLTAAAQQCSLSPASTINSDEPPKAGGRTKATTSVSKSSIFQAKDKFVEQAQLFEYWESCAEHIIESEFKRAKLLLMVDKQPAMEMDSFAQSTLTTNPDRGCEMRMPPRLKVFDYQELRDKLIPYGLEIGTLNSALLAVWDGGETTSNSGDFQALFGTSLRLMVPPKESGLPPDSQRRELERALEVRFLDIRHAMLTMDQPVQRNWLAKFQSLTKWYRLYQHCPRCTQPLKMQSTKASAHCKLCSRDYYPPIWPVAICLLVDQSNEWALLVRHRGVAGQVFTCVAGFCSTGETLEQTVRREIAEELGILCRDIRPLNGSQPWPIPDASLMIPFMAIASPEDKIHTSIAELENAKWFSRREVLDALKRVEEDPFMLGLHRHLQTSGKDPEVRQKLRYIPWQGAIAHYMIKEWALRKS